MSRGRIHDSLDLGTGGVLASVEGAQGSNTLLKDILNLTCLVFLEMIDPIFKHLNSFLTS